MKINHIGFVCKNIKRKLKAYVEDYGYTQVTSIMKIENQGVNVVMVKRPEDDLCFELIEPLHEDSPIMTALKRGGGINHVCYEVDNIEEVYEKYKRKVVRELKPAPLEYFNGGRTFFIFNKGDLIEFLEKKDA